MPRPRKALLSPSAKVSPDEEEEEKVAPPSGSPSPPLKRQKTTYASPDVSPAPKAMEGSPSRVSTRSSSSSSQTSVKSGRASGKRSLQKQGRQEDDDIVLEPTTSDAPHVVTPMPPGDGEDVEEAGKRNRSLEALFRVTDSELASMSKQGTRKVAPEVKKSPQGKSVTVLTGSASGETVSQTLSGNEVTLRVNTKSSASPQSVRIVRVSQMSSGGGMTPSPSMSILPVTPGSSSGTPVSIVMTSVPSTPVATPSGSGSGVKLDTPVSISLPNLSNLVTLPGHTVITLPAKSQMTASQNLARALSEEVPRHLVLDDGTTTYTTSQSFDVEGHPKLSHPKKAISLDASSPVMLPIGDLTSPGRRPKMMSRPGKYPCPFCHRTCAKPSVLEKHIRAHTNERPFPCEVCNIAFKTKSNLFKHKKSRAHLLKANPGAVDQLRMSSGSKDSMEEDMEMEEMDDGNETDVSMETIGSSLHQDSLTSQDSISESVDTPGRQTFYVSGIESTLTVVQTSSGELKLALPQSQSVDSAEKILQTPDAELKAKRERLKKGQGSSLPNLPVQHSLSLPMQRQLSIGNLAGPKLTVSELANLPEGLKTERINAHINQLISANNDIVSAPKAAPPRPKRVTRILHSKSDSSVSESAIASHNLLASTSFDSFESPATPMVRMGNPHLLQGSSSSLDSPDISQLMSRSMESQSTPNIHSMISKSTPQEIKIQIKLAPPGGSEAGGSSSSGGGIISSPLSFMPTPGTPGVRPGLKTPISISSLTPILSNTIGTPVNINTPIRTPSSVSPLIGQPVVQFPRATVAVPSMTNTGSTPVKDLLAQKKSAGTPMVIIESPEGEKTTPEGKSLDGSGGTLGRQVIYLNQQGSLDIPQHVAEQVEIVSSNVRGKQGIVRSLSVPSSATYAGTPSVAPGNIIFEQYDPHTPPKRGRPKGSRNLARDQPPVPLAPNTAPTTPLTPNFQAGRFPLLPQAPIVAPTTNNPRPTLKLMIPSQGGSPIMQSPIVLSSQSLTLTSGSLTLTPAMTFTPGSSLTPQTAPMFSTLASPVKQDGTPGTPGTPNTPTAHLKKILKGLLLKRSVSMSSGLNTTKEGGSSKTSLLSSPQKYLRSESVDDTAFRQQLGSDSPPTGLSVRRPPLVRQSKSDAGIVPISRSEEKKLEAGLEEGEVLMIDSQAEEEEAMKKGPKIPVNEHQEVYLPMGHHTCPLLVNTKPFPKQLAIIPSLLSGKAKLVNWDSKERDGSVDTTDSQHDSATGSQDSSAETPTDTVQGSAEMEEDPKTSSDTPEPMEVEIKATKQSSTESGIDMTSSDIPSPELPEDKAALEHRARMQILLLSHQYPILRNDTHTTFCTVVKPQPAYVAMEGMQISMYSNWRAATYNPNPQGLTSRQLMDLYHSRWYDVAPSLTSSAKINDDKHSTLTHSSYWNYYGDGVKQEEQQISRKDAKSAADTVMKLLRLEKDPLDVEIESKETPLVQESPPPAVQQTVVVIESDISAEPAVASTTQSIDVAAEPTTATPQPKDSKRILLGIAGGYKTNEDYVYIRGKGRGKYVCELCGIRCKKPSMLKKHIRSHSDFRPYICTYCNLNFKTKGNLTKHMKSKSHHKRCVHLGITPVPTTVDEAQIDNDVLTKQSIFAWSTRIVDVSPGSNDGSIADDDEDDDDDDNDNDEQIEEEEVETTMVIEDGTVIEVETSKDIESEEREVPGELIQIQDEVTGEVQLLYMDAQPEVTVEQEETEEGQVTKIVLTSPDGKQGDGGRPSMDKELAAHTLLDLSKQTDPQPDDSSSEKDAPMEDKDASPGDKRRKLPRQQCISDDDTSQDRGDQRLDSLIGQLKTRTQAPEKPTPITETGAALLTKVGHSAAVSSTRMAATIFQSSSPSKPTSDVTPKTSSPSSPPALTRSDSIPGRKGGTTYAQKIAALQSKNELDLKLGIGDGATKGAGFVPPVFGIETRVEEKAVTKPTVTPSSRPRLVKSDSEPTARPVQATLGIHNPRILMRQKSVDIDSRTSEHDKPQTLTLLGHREGGAAHRRRSLSRQASVTDPDEDQPESSEVVTIEIPGPEGGIAKIQVPLHVFKQSSTTHTATVTTPKVQYVTEGNHAPHEIHPIPGKVSDKTGGPYACSECDKVLPNQQLLTLHQKSHLLECAHKCDDCSQSFRSKALLQKHQRTNEHKARVALNQQVASAQGDTSRLFRCTECDVAFYTHGNLAKHLRSHKHIMSLEKVGKLPIGAALQLESTDLKSLDCTDSESALRGLLHFYDPASYPPPGKDDPQSSSKDQSADSEEYMFDNGGYERVASNEKVTVEMKTNTIDLSDISQRRGETHEEDGDDGQGQSVSGHGSRCGICRQNFNSTDALQRHMPSHAELRPYVCQHCDAGFTTYLFLEAHLAKCFKQSQQTYMCGNCKDTFMSISSLQQHQCNAKPVTMGTAASSSSQPNIVTPSSSPQVVQMIPVSADGKVLYLPLIQSSSTKPVQLVRSRSIAAAPSTPEFTSRHPLLLRSASDAGVFMEGTLPTPVPESPSVHTPFIQGTAPQSPLMLRPTPNSPHSPLRYLPRIQSPLVRGSLPISPLALPTTSTPTQIAHVTRNLFRDSSNTSTLGPQGTFKVTSGNLSPLVTAERLTSQGHLTSRSLVSSLQSQGQFQTIHSQVQGHGTSKVTVAPSMSYHPQRSESTSQLQGAVQVVTTMGGYQAADEATKQHLAKLLNTDQDSLGQVQVMELEGDSIHQMSHMAQATGEDGEVVYVIQMNEDQESLGLQFQTTSAGGASLSLAGGEGTIHGVSRLLSDQKDAGEIYEESETQNQGTVLHEHQGFNPMEGGNGTMMDISHAPSQSSGTTLDAKRKEPEDSESIEGQPPRKKRMLDS